jgi:hypothetical protein
MYSKRYFCQLLTKLEFSLQIFEIYPNIKFNEKSPSGSGVSPCGETDSQRDMTKVRLVFRNFANAHKNVLLT